MNTRHTDAGVEISLFAVVKCLTFKHESLVINHSSIELFFFFFTRSLEESHVFNID